MADEPEKGFLSRWSQRKAEARQQEVAEPATAPEQAEEQFPEAVDVEALPPVEGLDETSDFTPFLRKGVPDTLRRAALRKLWVTEPSVVNYVPLVEYAWHNNEPGFGPLLPTDNVEQLLKQIIEGNPFSLPPEPETPPQDKPMPETAALETPAEQPLTSSTEPQDAPAEIEQPARPRRHGGALPG